MRRPVLYLDFETSPIVGCTWVVYDAEVFHILADVKIISAAWSWEGEDKVYCISLPEFRGYKPGWLNVDDRKLVESFSEIFDKAEAVIAHNGKGFDFKLWRTRLIVHGLNPHRDIKELDTKQWARRFRFSNNKQENISRQLGTARKMETRKNLHRDCLEYGDKRAWREMVAYNKRDVLGLKENARRMAPFVVSGMPDPNILFGTVLHCNNLLCGSANLRSKGPRAVQGGHKVEYLCRDCGHYRRGPLIRT